MSARLSFALMAACLSLASAASAQHIGPIELNPAISIGVSKLRGPHVFSEHAPELGARVSLRTRSWPSWSLEVGARSYLQFPSGDKLTLASSGTMSGYAYSPLPLNSLALSLGYRIPVSRLGITPLAGLEWFTPFGQSNRTGFRGRCIEYGVRLEPLRHVGFELRRVLLSDDGRSVAFLPGPVGDVRITTVAVALSWR
ncbi:MAG: hypothetical protein JWO05_771 [Gemmatimonadetes bacterium]|nr:hypothetical protein [Gemmatimonadota bacterium]